MIVNVSERFPYPSFVDFNWSARAAAIVVALSDDLQRGCTILAEFDRYLGCEATYCVL